MVLILETANNGQVDWFLSGGGWDDLLIGGDSSNGLRWSDQRPQWSIRIGVPEFAYDQRKLNEIFGGTFLLVPQNWLLMVFLVV